MTLLTVSFLFFCAAALGGAVLAHGHATKTHLPGPLVVGHPLLAASGLILLGAAWLRVGGSSLLTAALVVLAVATALGMGVAYVRLRRGRAPMALVLFHALVALTGAGLVLAELIAGAPRVPAPVQSAAADRELPHPTHDPGGPRGEVEEDP